MAGSSRSDAGREQERIPGAFGQLGLHTSWAVDRRGRSVPLRHGENRWNSNEMEAFLRALAER